MEVFDIYLSSGNKECAVHLWVILYNHALIRVPTATILHSVSTTIFTQSDAALN